MAVVIETTLGDITVDLYIKQRPRSCINFLKLCKMKYYNFNLFHMVNRGFIAQTGDPEGSGDGGESIWGLIDGPTKRYFEAENSPRIKHTTAGLVSFVGDKNNMLGSQFFITLAPDLTYLDAQHCVFGEVVEGLDVLHLLNESICDGDHRPYQDIRIAHTVVLEDPFPDPEGLVLPDCSPEPTADRLKGGRIAPDEDIDETAGKSATEIAEIIADREAKARATILEMVGDIPDAEMAPPENVLFVCKLNPVTNDDDLEIIFSRFGKIKSCEVIRDKKTGDSLQYAFVEFEDPKACEDAYFKMDNVLIDDRRIHVDFSQSVAKVRWYGKGRIKYDDNSNKEDFGSGKYKKNNSRKDNNSKNKSLKDPDKPDRNDRIKADRSRDRYYEKENYRKRTTSKEKSDQVKRSTNYHQKENNRTDNSRRPYETNKYDNERRRRSISRDNHRSNERDRNYRRDKSDKRRSRSRERKAQKYDNYNRYKDRSNNDYKNKDDYKKPRYQVDEKNKKYKEIKPKKSRDSSYDVSDKDKLSRKKKYDSSSDSSDEDDRKNKKTKDKNKSKYESSEEEQKSSKKKKSKKRYSSSSSSSEESSSSSTDSSEDERKRRKKKKSKR